MYMYAPAAEGGGAAEGAVDAAAVWAALCVSRGIQSLQRVAFCLSSAYAPPGMCSCIAHKNGHHIL